MKKIFAMFLVLLMCFSMCGAMPNSVCCPAVSSMGQAEKRTVQPLGRVLLSGSPEPPPVVSPSTITCGRGFSSIVK